MTIRYQNGKASEAITLSHDEDVMRVLVRGSEDIVELTRLNGTWVTEDCEPVTIEHSAARRSAEVSETDCICPAGFAAQLIGLLYKDSSEDLPFFGKPAMECSSCEAQP